MGADAVTVVDAELDASARILLGLAYLAVLVGAFTAFVALQMGWRLPYVTLWDGRARLVASFATMLLAFFGLAGGLQLAGPPQLPRAVRVVSGWAAGFTLPFLFNGALALSAQSTLADAFYALTWWGGIGAAMGAASGLVTLLGKPEPVPRQGAWRRHLGLLACATIVAGAAAFELMRDRPRDDGRSTAALRLTTSAGWVEAGVQEAPLIGTKMGYVRVCEGGRLNIFVGLEDEWPALVRLLNQVRPTSSGVRRIIGDVDDDTGDATTLTLSDGPDVRVALSSPKGPNVVATISTHQALRLREAVLAVDGQLH